MRETYCGAPALSRRPTRRNNNDFVYKIKASAKKAGEARHGWPAEAGYALQVGGFYPLWQDGGGYEKFFGFIQGDSQMPRHLISDAHEWINEIPTVPIYYLANPQEGERACA